MVEMLLCITEEGDKMLSFKLLKVPFTVHIMVYKLSSDVDLDCTLLPGFNFQNLPGALTFR